MRYSTLLILSDAKPARSLAHGASVVIVKECQTYGWKKGLAVMQIEVSVEGSNITTGWHQTPRVIGQTWQQCQDDLRL